MHDLVTVELPRKEERISIPFDPETYKRLEELAAQEERSIARQVTLLVKAALELLDEQDFHVVGGKLRKVTFEPLDTDEESHEG